MAFEIDLLELKRAVDRLFDHIVRDLKIVRVEIHEDYYWHVDGDALHDMASTPVDENGTLNIGSLAADWDSVSRLLRDENETVVRQLTEVAPLLRYIGEKVRGW